ncbi:MAG: PAS domain-containing sensor histidine kinase [Devosiaceae bacterium]|nr:PAS domain-containing sensor histidine kinase [Devosiaceae bacterium MH13]
MPSSLASDVLFEAPAQPNKGAAMTIAEATAAEGSDPLAGDDHYLKSELYELVSTDPAIFEFLQAGSLDGIWYWDLEKMEHEWLSDRFKHVFGYQPDEMAHTPEWWQANIHPADLATALKNFEQHASDPSHPYDQIVRYKHKDGSTVWVRCRGLAIRDENGKPMRMLGAHTDVTALKQTEQELAEANTLLAKRNEMLSQFAGIAAHDLSSPLRQMGLYCEMVREELLNGNIEGATNLLDQVENRITQTRGLVRTILDYSVAGLTIQSGRSANLETCLSDAVASLDADPESFDLSTRFEDEPEINGDSALLLRVLVNLLSNALKYSDQQRTKIEIVGARTHAGGYQLTVTDNGPGIAADKAETIFEPFARATPDGKARGGYGIGLALCRRIMESHGGSIHVENTYADGARFVLTFP